MVPVEAHINIFVTGHLEVIFDKCSVVPLESLSQGVCMTNRVSHGEEPSCVSEI